MNPYKAMQQYRQVGASSASYQDPVRLIQMLYETALERLTLARRAVRDRMPADKSRHIDRVIKIVESLQIHLDREQGGEIAENLDRLYDYINRRLLRANLDNDEMPLEEIHQLLEGLLQAWREVPVRAARPAAVVQQR